MKAILSQFWTKQSIGLSIGESCIGLSVVKMGPFGTREVCRETRAVGDQTIPVAVKELLTPWIGERGDITTGISPWVKLVVPESRTFQAVVPITRVNRNAVPQSLFLEAVRATNIRPDERIIDLLKIELGKQPLACVAAAPLGEISSLVAMVSDLGTRVGLAEPAPAALYRAGEYYRKPPRGSTLAARFFLGERQAIGVLAANGRTLFWHAFELPAGDETAAILAAYSTLRLLGRRARIKVAIDTVIVHGRSDLILAPAAAAFRDRAGMRFIRCDQPDYDQAATAFGVALADSLDSHAGHDFARALKPPATIRELFPWGELMLHVVLVAAASLFLVASAAELDSRLKAVRAQLTDFAWLNDQNPAGLDAKKKDFESRVEVLRTFRDGAVDWSAVLRTIAAVAPESTVITSLSGDAEVETTTKSSGRKPRKQLIVTFATPMSADGSMPPEIHGFLTAMRSAPAIKRHFPVIEVSGLQADVNKNEKIPLASYSIVCLAGRATIKTAAH